MRKKLKQIFSAALAGIVMCTAITFYPVETKAAAKAATTDVWDGVLSTDWMSYLDDSLKISEINLPGTHDSGTKKVTSSSSAQCQDKSITEQLNAGIRFLDIRLENDGTKLRLVHGSADCKSEDGSNLYLDEVLKNCYDFLDAHSSETIVMSLKKDDGDATDADVETYIHNYIGSDKEKYWHLNNNSPALSDVRGKIVLMRRYHSASDDYAGDKGVRIFWGDQGGSTVVDPPWPVSERVSRYGYLRFYVQDRYEYSASNKWTAIQKGLDNPPHTSNERKQVEDNSYINITPQNTFFLNFMSSAGTSILTTPKSVANTVNANFKNYNNGSLEYGKNYGWIIMDFATEELAKRVYQSNKSPKLEVASTIRALETVIPSEVASDMTLPSDGEEVGGTAGTSITWSCNPASVLKINGTQATLVCPTSGDVTAALKATVTSGSCSQQQSFTVQIKSLDAIFSNLSTALRKAEEFIDDAANAKYNLESLKTAVETAKKLVQAGADNVSNTQVNAATEALNTLMKNGFELKSTAELKENLLGWYPLTASGKDVSGNHNNGTVTGVTFDKEKGAAFTGGNSRTSYISLPADMFKRTADNDNLTVSFWVKDEKGTNSNAFGFGNGTQCDPVGNAKHIIVNTNKSGNIYVNACLRGWSEGDNNIQTAAPSQGTWFHLTIVMEGKKFTLYKDGVKVKDITEDYSLAEMGNMAFAYIGNAIYAHNSDNDFKGNIKDFRVYDCAIAPEQAAAIYNDKDMADTSVTNDHLLAHYPLTADSKDVSGNHYDATATGVTFSAESGAAFKGGNSRTSYISLPTNVFDQILGNDKMTVSFWIRDEQGANSNAFGFGDSTDCGVAKHFIVNMKDGDNILVNACPKGWDGDDNNIKTAAPSVGAWCHLTIVMDGKTMSLYKDGKKINTITETYSLAEMGSIAFAYIGTCLYAHNPYNGGDKDFKGNIKDFRIYDCALNEAEAKESMNDSIKEELMADLETALNLDITKGEDGSLSMNITDGSLTLPTTACGGAATISWASSNTDIIDNTGKVTLPAASEPIADVTLTATVTINGKTTEIIFHCSVFTKLEFDTADLQAVISSVEITTAGLNAADYTASSWNAFQQALNAAKQQVMKPTSEADVDAAATDLQAKKNALVKLGDKTALNALINTVKSLKQDDYTTATWTAFKAALTAAEEAAESNDVSQANVDTAKTNLDTKKTALVKRGDKTNLNAAIKAAESLQEEDYTTETWTPFYEKLTEVKNTAADIDATTADIEAAEQSLDAAVKTLKKITYTVTFKPDNGSDDIPVIVEKGETVTAPQVPKKEGFAFTGWFEEGAQTEFDLKNTPITSDITLTAQWVEGHTVIFNPDNDTESWTVPVEDGGKVSKPETIPEKEGYEFEYWYEEDEDNEFDFANTSITADITLTAKWKEILGNVATLKPNVTQQGTGSINVDVDAGSIEFGEKTEVVIDIPDSIAENIKNCEGTEVSINVNIPDGIKNNENIDLTTITLPKEALEAARDKGKDLIVTVNGDNSYRWVFKAEQLASAEITAENLLIQKDSAKEAEAKNKLNSDEEGMVFSIAQEGAVPESVSVNAAEMKWGPGDELNLSYYDFATQKLEPVSGTYTVDENGKVAIKNPKAGTTYVLWRKISVTVTGITLNKTNLTLVVGKGEKLQASVQPESAAGTTVTWTSKNQGVATVAQDGTVTAVAVGETTITATAGDKTATCKVTVNEGSKIIKVKTLKINAKKLTLGGGEKFTLKVTINPKNATNTQVTWTSSNNKAATVNTKGVVIAKKVKKPAKTTITANVDGKTIQCVVTVKPAPKKIALSAKSKTLKKGKTFQVKVKYTPKNAASYKLTYSIDKKGKKVVSVDSKGKIKAKKKGKATITVTTYNKKKATIKITVK